MEIINPYTKKLIKTINNDDENSVQTKFQDAQKSFLNWKNQPFSARKYIIEEFKKALNKRSEEGAAILTEETGKPINQSRNEIKGTIPRIEYFLEKTENLLLEDKVFHQNESFEKITYEPLGVIANISAWNYPYFIGTNIFIPALLAGNTVLYKPSEYSSLTGLFMEDIFNNIEGTRGLFQTVVGKKDVGQLLLSLPIQGIFFTGSFKAGKWINETSAKNLMKVNLELGGKDAVYITEDIDIENTVASVSDGIFYNAGQSCCSIERIYIHKEVYQPVLEGLVNHAKKYILADPKLESTTLGPITLPNHIEFLEHLVKDATAKGGTLLTGGKKCDSFFETTLIGNVNQDMDLMTKEIFGPMASVTKTSTDKEALSLINSSSFGLTSSIYCHDFQRANNFLGACDTGTVYWNTCDRVSPMVPWSGRKNSGLGSTLGEIGVRSFVKPKSWQMKETTPKFL